MGIGNNNTDPNPLCFLDLSYAFYIMATRKKRRINTRKKMFIGVKKGRFRRKSLKLKGGAKPQKISITKKEFPEEFSEDLQQIQIELPKSELTKNQNSITENQNSIIKKCSTGLSNKYDDIKQKLSYAEQTMLAFVDCELEKLKTKPNPSLAQKFTEDYENTCGQILEMLLYNYDKTTVKYLDSIQSVCGTDTSLKQIFEAIQTLNENPRSGFFSTKVVVEIVLSDSNIEEFKKFINIAFKLFSDIYSDETKSVLSVYLKFNMTKSVPPKKI